MNKVYRELMNRCLDKNDYDYKIFSQKNTERA